MAGDIGVHRKLSQEIRNLTLKKIKVILEKPVVELNDYDKQLHDEPLKILARSVLPRITEMTGEDGGAIKAEITGIKYVLPNGNNNPPGTEAAPGLGSSTASDN